ncbi:MAG: septation protein IspZ [Pseudomonadota bacterium]
MISTKTNQPPASPLSRGFFLFSFLPALAYWYLEAYYPVRVAVAGGVLLAVLEIGLEKWLSKKVHSLSKFNFFLVVFLGIISLLASKGIWFKMQPALSSVGIVSFLFWRLRKGQSILVEMMQEMPGGGKKLAHIPVALWFFMERNLGIFLSGYGIWMGFAAWKCSTSVWLFGKTGGFYIATALFMVVEMVMMRFRMRHLLETRQEQMDALTRFRPNASNTLGD